MTRLDYDWPIPCDRCQTHYALIERDGETVCRACAYLIDQVARLAHVRRVSERHSEETADIEDATAALWYS